MFEFNIQAIRAQFPALRQTGASGQPRVYLDGPAGTQVPQSVIDAMVNYLITSNSNTHGQFETSRRTDEIIYETRRAMADFLGAARPDSIVIGNNMTTLTFHLSRALAEFLQPGDEIIISRLDHDANIAPWLALEKRGMRVRWLPFSHDDCTLQIDRLDELISHRTRLIAVGYASNAVGTINPVQDIIARARERNILTFIDAVHYAPHGLIDVQALGCDFLACSAYKFFGPHVGILYVHPDIGEQLQPDKVRPQEDTLPDKFETGTLNLEGIAGVRAAVDYLASVHELAGAPAEAGAGRRERLVRSMRMIAEYEQTLSRRLLLGLQSLPHVRIYGIQDAARLHQRTPTFGIRVEGLSPAEVARRLGKRDIYVWDGDFFAMEPVRQLGLADSGGLVRIGAVHYNTESEMDRLLEELKRMAKSA